MRQKVPCFIISFHTTNDAVGFEKEAGACGFPGRLIPIPRAITAGCGMAWRIEKQEAPELSESVSLLQEKLSSMNVRFDVIYEIDA